MKMIEIPNIRALGELMLRVSEKEKLSLTAVVFFDEAEELLRFFIHKRNVRTDFIELKQIEYGYNKEYYVTLWNDGVFSIEPAYDEESDCYPHIIMTDALFFDGGSSSKIAVIHSHIPQFELMFHSVDDRDIAVSESVSIVDNVDYINFMFPLTKD